VPHNRQVIEDAGTRLPDPDLPPASWGREGYHAAEVDDFVGQLEQALRRDPPTMAPYEVADQRFKVSRFGRRYRLREVDDFLQLAQERLRERHGEDAVAQVEGVAPEPRHFPTGWIYLVALVLVAVMVLFLVTQL
jgi:DivIVA domain-containing protein